jgi:hypothetical protein
MNVFKVDIYKSFGGRSNRGNWMNTHYFAAPLAINSPEVRANAMALVNAEASAHYSQVFFMRAHISAVSVFGLPDPTDNFVTIQLQNRGQRVLQGELSPQEIVLEIQRDCETGRSGALSYRGCLAESDIVTSADNSYQISAPAAFDGLGTNSLTIIDMLNAGLPNGTLCIPEREGLLFKSYRNVVLHRLGGVGIRQTSRRTRSIEAEEVRIAQRKINQTYRRLMSFLNGRDVSLATLGADLATVNELITVVLNVIALMTPIGRAKLLVPAVLKQLV